MLMTGGQVADEAGGMRLPRTVLAVALLLPATAIMTILGGFWLSPSTAHAASSYRWTLVWKCLAIAAVGLVAWLIVEGARRGRPVALAGRVLLGAVALTAVWSARFESYGQISAPAEQTYVWPFGDGPVSP